MEIHKMAANPENNQKKGKKGHIGSAWASSTRSLTPDKQNAIAPRGKKKRENEFAQRMRKKRDRGKGINRGTGGLWFEETATHPADLWFCEETRKRKCALMCCRGKGRGEGMGKEMVHGREFHRMVKGSERKKCERSYRKERENTHKGQGRFPMWQKKREGEREGKKNAMGKNRHRSREKGGKKQHKKGEGKGERADSGVVVRKHVFV